VKQKGVGKKRGGESRAAEVGSTSTRLEKSDLDIGVEVMWHLGYAANLARMLAERVEGMREVANAVGVLEAALSGGHYDRLKSAESWARGEMNVKSEAAWLMVPRHQERARALKYDLDQMRRAKRSRWYVAEWMHGSIIGGEPVTVEAIYKSMPLGGELVRADPEWRVNRRLPFDEDAAQTIKAAYRIAKVDADVDQLFAREKQLAYRRRRVVR
jgi:hypothetical protein